MIIPLLFAVTIHEVAHGYVAYRMGDNTAMLAGRLTLNPIKHLDFIGSFLLPLILKFTGSPIIFGYAKPVPVNFANLRDYRKGVIYVSSAGVLANFACAFISGILFQLLLSLKSLWYNSAADYIVSTLILIFGYSVIINCVLAIFNMIPVPPLDGSKIFAMFLPLNLRRQYARLERFGIVIIFFLLMTNSLDKIVSFFINPLINFLLGK
ncbi:MAG: site-2 protease family protein [Desulfobacteraceae bacterium]|nr:site-2 protease family protein [Desulfobacteraceae bacterium]MBC2718563.1 site-2 protease family protein [Desulfobacteraceae bacterium]